MSHRNYSMKAPSYLNPSAGYSGTSLHLKEGKKYRVDDDDDCGASLLTIARHSVLRSKEGKHEKTTKIAHVGKKVHLLGSLWVFMFAQVGLGTFWKRKCVLEKCACLFASHFF